MKTYSYKKDKNKKLSANFTVGEFRCKDGSDVIMIEDKLVTVLQKIRNKFGKPVTITSGYRTAKYNSSIGGASNSQHVKGCAADIKISGVDPVKIAKYADEFLGSSGGVELGSYGTGKSGYVHVDVRGTKWRAIRPTASGSYTSYTVMFPLIKYGSSGSQVLILSRKLTTVGIEGTIHSSCDANFVSRIKEFQKKYNLTVDGLFGTKSWNKLIELI